MGAPAATTRQAPSGLRLTDGHSTKITFARDPDVSLWETGVTPPGVDGGEAIDTTTMHNVTWRTRAPRSLVDLSEMTFTAAYDPAIFNNVLQLININDQVTVAFPDGSTLAFWGFLRVFTPNEHTEGTMPTASVTVTPTNMDDAGAEQAPVVVSVAGT